MRSIRAFEPEHCHDGRHFGQTPAVGLCDSGRNSIDNQIPVVCVCARNVIQYYKTKQEKQEEKKKIADPQC